MTKQTILFDGDTFTHAGMRFIVSIKDDNDHGVPWVNEDGHGPVSEWTSRDKKPGEWVLSSDRGSKRFYDAAEAIRIAKRDGWGLGEECIAEMMRTRETRFRNAGLKRLVLQNMHGPIPYPTKGEIISEAVRRDFEYLQGWCNDDWNYVGVCVRHISQDADDIYFYATWGIESNSVEYIAEAAHELASECLRDIQSEIATNRATLKTIRQQFKALTADMRKSATLAPAICDAVKSKLQSLMNDRAQAMARISTLAA